MSRLVGKESAAVRAIRPHDGILEVVDVVYSYGGVRAVSDASFAVRRGSVTGLMGPNGAGKSTLLSIISGALAPTSGSIVFDGVNITDLPAYERARRGLIRTFQIASEFAGLTVMENLLVGDFHLRGERLRDVVRGRKAWRADEDRAVTHARDLLERFGMAEKQNELAGTLSGGQKRILELLRALMARPKLLVLDEPIAGVHPRTIDLIVRWLGTLRDEGITVLMTEHELGVLERLCDPVIVMADGRVIAEGTVRDVRRQPEVLNAYLVR